MIISSEKVVGVMTKREKSDKQLIGAAGEHLVLSRLLSRGKLASQAPRGTRDVDILVNPLDGGRPIHIQVKTRSGTGTERKRWAMTSKNESISSPDIYYCFVDLEDIDNPDVYVIPSKVVAQVIKVGHAKWLKQPGVGGKKHNDSDMRSLSNSPRIETRHAFDGWMDKYLEAWELLD